MERMQEAELVRESLYALQGLPSAVRRLEHLSAVYLATEADIRALRVSGTIWSRSASSNAVGKLLLEFANAGRVRCCLDLFVKFFLDEKPCFTTPTKRRFRGYNSSIASKALRKQVKELQRKRWGAYRQVKVATRGLVNQAFAKAVRSISLAHNDALSNLLASVSKRRSGSWTEGYDARFNNGVDSGGGPVEARDITLLELHLHTKNLLGQLQELASICFCRRDSNPAWTSDFLCGETYMDETVDGRKEAPSMDQMVVIFSQWHDFLLVVQDFPRGASLLSFLYSKLLDADVLQINILRFLFARSWQPYSVFVESWLYHATVRDPYSEFIVEQSPLSNAEHLFNSAEDFEQGLTSEITIRKEAAVPNFLREVSIPLLRAGQQLQVLLKLPETRDFAQQLAGYILLTNPTVKSQETGRSFWSEHRSRSSLFSTLGFSKQKLDKGLRLREERSHVITERFNQLFGALMSRAETSRPENEHRTSDLLLADSSIGDLFCDTFSDFQLEEFPDISDLYSSGTVMEMRDTPRTALKNLHSLSTENASLEILSHEEHPEAGEASEADNHTMAVLSTALSSSAQTEHENDVPVSSILVPELSVETSTESQVNIDNGSCDKTSKDCVQLWVNGGLNDEHFEDMNVKVNSLLIRGTGDAVSDVKSTESFLADFLMETWSVGALPENPFMVSGASHFGEAHVYGSIHFPESGEHWNLNAKIVDRGIYSKRYFEKAPKDPLRRERRILAELPFINYSEYPFLDKHLAHGLGNSDFLDVSIFTGALPIQQTKQIANPKEEAARTVQAYGQVMPPESSNGPRNVGGLGDMFNYLDEALSREGRGRKVWQLYENFNVQDSGTFVRTSLQLQSEPDEVLESTTYAAEKTGHDNDVGDQNTLARAEGGVYIKEDSVKDSEISAPPFSSLYQDKEARNCVSEKEIGSLESTYPYFCASTFMAGGIVQLRTESSAGGLEDEEIDCEIDGDIPFVVVLDKSIIQEILVQYKSVSFYTVKVLEEVLRLRDHYVALRRYFFMETADWADNFVAALCDHRWGLLSGQSKVLAVQGMLESALQRSSCEGDEFTDRLYIASFGADHVNAMGSSEFKHERIETLKSIDLGYRVNWPLTLVLTSSSLKRYSRIFSFLIGIKSTVHALSHICGTLKGIRHDFKDEIKRSQHQKDCFRMLQVFRWQVCHFVTSLQRYLESSLLHVVWSQFLRATEIQEKDIYELEALHADYLTAAENRCFLTKTTAAVRLSVDKILRLVFDFETHLKCASSDTGRNVLSDFLFSQACRLNLVFQECMRHLHSCSIRPEYRSSLSDFWMCLDHNGFLARACSNQLY